MGCCGSRRRQAAAWPSTTVRSVTHTTPTATAAAGETVVLRYHGEAPVILTGPITGTRYPIAQSTQDVVARAPDAPSLVATGRFSRI